VSSNVHAFLTDIRVYLCLIIGFLHEDSVSRTCHMPAWWTFRASYALITIVYVRFTTWTYQGFVDFIVTLVQCRNGVTGIRRRTRRPSSFMFERFQELLDFVSIFFLFSLSFTFVLFLHFFVFSLFSFSPPSVRSCFAVFFCPFLPEALWLLSLTVLLEVSVWHWHTFYAQLQVAEVIWTTERR